MVNPFALPLWLAGLGWLFFGREGRRYRVLGWAFVVTFAVFMILHGKDYYVAPAYPMLFAAGGVVCEEWIERTRRTWLKPAFVLVLLIPSAGIPAAACAGDQPGAICRVHASDSLHAASQRAQPRAVSAAAVLFRRTWLGSHGGRGGARLSQPAA